MEKYPTAGIQDIGIASAFSFTMEAELANSESGLGSLVKNESHTKLEGQEDPLNWSILPKCKPYPLPERDNYILTRSLAVGMHTLTVVGIAGIVGFSSSVQTPAITTIAEDFKTSRPLSTLGSTTYLIGSAFDPLIFAPLSELWQVVHYSSFLIFCLANLGCVLSPNIAAFLSFRFLVSLFGLSAVANSGGSITDLWPQSHHSVPFALFTAASFCGPVLGPIIGGFLT